MTQVRWRLGDLAERLGCRVEGDASLVLTGVATLESAAPGEVSFFANPRYGRALRATRASAVILDETAPGAPCAMLRTRLPYLALARALALFTPPRPATPGVHPRAWVSESARIAPDAEIGPFVSVEDGAVIGPRSVLRAHVSVGAGARVGADCVVHPHVSVREGVVIGDRVVLQDGVVVGGDGFGFARRADGTHEKIPQVGRVVIGDDVEIGAGTTIDRPALGETRIGAGTKIDNLVQVAHGVTLGRNVLLAAQVGIAGSATLEDGVVLGGQVGVAGHITLGAGASAVGQTGITNALPPGAFVAGYPAIDHRLWLRACAVFKQLPDLKRAVARLEAAAVPAADGTADPRGDEGPAA
jgi:UDP-3-O-[3-hydroxymyristoyl] glucosamine N-acyltransferase